MGLEAATFVQQLTSTNPLAGDKKNQGDDHLRLLKAVLKNTFPNASKGFYFPDFVDITVDTTLDATYAGKLIFANSTAATRTLTLPALVLGDAGWSIVVTKSVSGANPVFVVPNSGSIVTVNAGGGFSVAKVRCDVMLLSHRFFWTGSQWFHSCDGPFPGEIQLFAGATLPPGFGSAVGTSLLRADHPELFNTWGTTYGAPDGTHFNAPDLRNRFPVFVGGSYALAATGGEAAHTLVTGELPTGVGGLTASVTDTRTFQTVNSISPQSGAGPIGDPGGASRSLAAKQAIEVASGTISGSVTGNLGSGTAHENRPPYFALTPIFRLC